MIESIVAAVVAGIIASSKETASLAVKDTYNGLKALVSARLGDGAIKSLERDPKSQNRQAVLAEELNSARHQDINELHQIAQTVLQEIQKDDATREMVQIELAGSKVGHDYSVADVTTGRFESRVSNSEIGRDVSYEGVNTPRRRDQREDTRDGGQQGPLSKSD